MFIVQIYKGEKMFRRDKINTLIKSNSSSANSRDLVEHQLPADYNAMDWDEFFEIFKNRQPSLYNKFVNK